MLVTVEINEQLGDGVGCSLWCAAPPSNRGQPSRKVTLGCTHIEGLATNQKANDESEKSQNGTENLNDKDFDEPIKCTCQ